MGVDLLALWSAPPATMAEAPAGPPGDGFADVLADTMKGVELPKDADGEGDEPELADLELELDPDELGEAMLALDDEQLELPLEPIDTEDELIAWAAQATNVDGTVALGGETLRTQPQRLPQVTAPPPAPAATPLTELPEPIELTQAAGPKVVHLRPQPTSPTAPHLAEPSQALTPEPASDPTEAPDPTEAVPVDEPPPTRAVARRPRRLEAARLQHGSAPVDAATATANDTELTPEHRVESLPTVADLDLPAETPEGFVAVPQHVRVELDDELAIEIASDGAEVDVRLEGTVQALSEQAGLQPELDERLGRSGWSLEHYDENVRDEHPREGSGREASRGATEPTARGAAPESRSEPAAHDATVSALA